MRQKSGTGKAPAEQIIKDIRRATRKQYSAEALNEPELSPRELAVTFIDTKGYFVSESSVFRTPPSSCARLWSPKATLAS